MEALSSKSEGLRERKRRDTLERIVETGLSLFIENGYEATTLDAIAAAAGISRRTFFYYFKSKEEVLLARQDGGFQQALRSALLACSPDQAPLDAVRGCLLGLASSYETKESIMIDRLMRSTDALRARKEARFIEIERTLVEAMGAVWPEPVQRDVLRTVAMMVIGTLRLSLEDWREGNAKHPLAYYLKRRFALLARLL